MTPLDAIEIVKSNTMLGMKKSVMMNGILYVSPAMYDLIKNEKGEELKRLLANLHIVDIGHFDPINSLNEEMNVKCPRHRMIYEEPSGSGVTEVTLAIAR